MSTEIWAALSGALVGAVSAGFLSLWLSKWQSERDRETKDRAMLGSIFHKIDFFKNLFLDLGRSFSNPNNRFVIKGFGRDVDVFIPPYWLDSIPRLDRDEITCILKLLTKRNSSFVDLIIETDARYEDISKIFSEYRSLYYDVFFDLCIEIQEYGLSVTVDDDDRRKLGARVWELENLSQYLGSRLGHAQDSARALVSQMDSELKKFVGFEFVERVQTLSILGAHEQRGP